MPCRTTGPTNRPGLTPLDCVSTTVPVDKNADGTRTSLSPDGLGAVEVLVLLTETPRLWSGGGTTAV